MKSNILKKPVCFRIAATGMLIFISMVIHAQGDLQIYPKRLMFDGTRRSQNLSLVNNGNDTARYVISVVQIRMKEDGAFENIMQPDPGQNFADKNFRFFPRSVVLGPKESQTVKVQLIQFSSLAAGEYRSHLYFRSEKGQEPLGKEKAASDSSSFSIQVLPVYGISIPVIIRTGESTVDISLSHIVFQFEKDSLPVLQFDINRSGNMSVYGDLTVDYVSNDSKEIRVADVKGLSVYTPNHMRRVRLLLDKQKGADFKKGALHIVFTDRSGKTEKVAQEQIFL